MGKPTSHILDSLNEFFIQNQSQRDSSLRKETAPKDNGDRGSKSVQGVGLRMKGKKVDTVPSDEKTK